MTKGFPAVCLEHPNFLIYNREGIGRHRDAYGCNADIVSIFSKRYKKWKKKRGLK